MDERTAGIMDLNTRKSRFSLAHIEAVASHAGFQVEEVKVDRDSIDGTIKADHGRRARIEFQAKATAREDILQGDGIHFPLSIKNYDDLRSDTLNPRLLMVTIIPSEIENWIDQSSDELCLRHCTYWMSLRGQDETSNQSTVTVLLPWANVFDRDGLVDLMQKVERTGVL